MTTFHRATKRHLMQIVLYLIATSVYCTFFNAVHQSRCYSTLGPHLGNVKMMKIRQPILIVHILLLHNPTTVLAEPAQSVITQVYT